MTSQCFCMNSVSGRDGCMAMRWTQWPTSASGSGMYVRDAGPWLIGFHVVPPSSVRKAPAAEMAMYDALRVGRVEQDRVQAQAAGAGLPVRPGAVLAQAGQLVPRRAAVGRAEEGRVLDAGVDRVGIGQRRLEVPHALELPRVRRAVVPLVRARARRRMRTCCRPGSKVLPPSSERWISCPNQPLRLRHVDPVRIDRRALEVVDLPAGEVRAADVPVAPLAVGREDEGTLAGADQDSSLRSCEASPRAARGRRVYLMPTTIESGPTSCSVRVDAKPASFIQPSQSAPV